MSERPSEGGNPSSSRLPDDAEPGQTNSGRWKRLRPVQAATGLALTGAVALFGGCGDGRGQSHGERHTENGTTLLDAPREQLERLLKRKTYRDGEDVTLIEVRLSKEILRENLSEDPIVFSVVNGTYDSKTATIRVPLGRAYDLAWAYILDSYPDPHPDAVYVEEGKYYQRLPFRAHKGAIIVEPPAVSPDPNSVSPAECDGDSLGWTPANNDPLRKYSPTEDCKLD